MKNVVPVALAVVALTAQAALALGQKECGLQAGLVMAVVQARTSGDDSATASRRVEAALDGATQKYATIVPALVDWVYALPQDKLGADVGESWAQACLAQ